MIQKIIEMKKIKLIIIALIILNQIILIQSEELLELKCFNETKCKQFEYDGVQSNCIQEHCQCHTEEGERVNCNPLSHKVNNIIGGPCPCQQPNTECDMQQEVCYCVRNYMPSNDRRRCIKKIATLEEKCELDLQCQRADYNAVCNADRKICLCMDHYINDEGKCASIVGLKSICSTDAQCIRNYDINSKCTNTTQHCVCEEGYLTSVDNSRCLKISKYLGKCIENIQCLGSMGLGGKCINNTCQCSEKYYVEEKKSANKKLETVCTAVIERGHSCRYEGDCYQRQLNESEQSMNCIFGECNCRLGFYSYNDGECLRESSGSGGIKPSINYNLIVYTICFVNIINFLK